MELVRWLLGAPAAYLEDPGSTPSIPTASPWWCTTGCNSTTVACSFPRQQPLCGLPLLPWQALYGLRLPSQHPLMVLPYSVVSAPRTSAARSVLPPIHIAITGLCGSL